MTILLSDSLRKSGIPCYFEPANNVKAMTSADDLVCQAREIESKRNQKDIADFLLLSGNAFMNAARSEIIST